MTLKEQLVKTVLKEFVLYLDDLKNGKIVEKELDNTSFPSIHGDEDEEGVK